MSNYYSKPEVQNTTRREILVQLENLRDEFFELDFHEEASGVDQAISKLMQEYGISNSDTHLEYLRQKDLAFRTGGTE